MSQTTVAHIIVERLKANNIIIDIPESLEDDLIKEHNWLLFSEDGPKLIKNYNQLFINVCQEVDYAIEAGVAHFSDEGIISIADNRF